MFMTSQEIIDLTGFKYAAKQIDWLKENGFLFEVGGDGRPKVLRSYVVNRLGGVVEPEPHEPKLRLG
jgi:hypothetical protein